MSLDRPLIAPGDLDMDAVEAELATLDAHINAATYRKLELIRLIDSSGRWVQQGAKSCAHWLSWRLGLSPGCAREQVRVARRLGDLPALDEELRHAHLTYSQVRAITRVATPENEARLIELAKHSTAAQLERTVRGVVVAVAEPGTAGDLERWVRQRSMADGTSRIEAQLTADEVTLVMAALRSMQATMRGEQADQSQPSAALADALVRVAEQVEARRDEAAPSRTGGDRTSLIVHVGPDVLDDERWSAHLDDGSRVPAETLRRLACDCSLVMVKEDAVGDALDVGRKTRRIPPALRRAVMSRDRGCAFPGCTHDRFIDCHHIEHWISGGETKKNNLVCLCTFHHRLMHEGGFSVSFDASGQTDFQAPDGRSLPKIHGPCDAHSSASRTGARLLEELLAAQVELALDEDTAYPQWDGSPADYAACVDSILGGSNSYDGA